MVVVSQDNEAFNIILGFADRDDANKNGEDIRFCSDYGRLNDLRRLMVCTMTLIEELFKTCIKI